MLKSQRDPQWQKLNDKHGRRRERPLKARKERGQAQARAPPIFLSIDDLREYGIPHHRQSLYRLIAQGKFPPPVKIGGRTAWRRDAIMHYLDNLPTGPTKRKQRKAA
jgi:hypothetical protein